MSSKSLNKVMLIGNLTRDPQIKVTPSGASVCTFGVATNSRYKKPDGSYEELTEFHNIVAWSKLAEICAAKLRKGMKVYVEGELRSRTWEGDNSQKLRKTEVRITEMIVIRATSGGDTHDDAPEEEDVIEVSASDESSTDVLGF
jgi:single-strand DNA-binding protein